MNGEERDGSYFKIVADYIHLNPVRSGWVGGETGRKLKSWRWSSYGGYAGNKRPDWLETGKVLRAFQLSDDHRGGRAYAGYLEARACDPKSAVTDASLNELRRGWYLGEDTFAGKVLDTLSGKTGPKRKKGSVAGAAANAHDQNEAERLAAAALQALGLPSKPSELAGRGMWIEEKALIATLIRRRTGVKNRWVAGRLAMGHEGNVTRATRRVNGHPARSKNLAKLEAMLVSED